MDEKRRQDEARTPVRDSRGSNCGRRRVVFNTRPQTIPNELVPVPGNGIYYCLLFGTLLPVFQKFERLV